MGRNRQKVRGAKASEYSSARGDDKSAANPGEIDRLLFKHLAPIPIHFAYLSPPLSRRIAAHKVSAR